MNPIPPKKPDGTCYRHAFYDGRCLNCPTTEWEHKARRAERDRARYAAAKARAGKAKQRTEDLA